MNNTTALKDINALYGKIPPQAIDVEEAVLGALMLEKDAYFSICDILTDQSFYKESHQIIFKTIQELVNQGKPTDLLMVSEQLKVKGLLDEIGGPVYITELTMHAVRAANIEYHARLIADKAMLREVIRFTSERGSQAYDQTMDVEDILSGLQNDLLKLFEVGSQRESTIAEAIHDLENRILQNQHNKGLTGIGTGLSKLDKFTGGLQKTDLIIVAGETSQGKTSFALTVLKNAVLNHKARAAVYSLEMSKEQLIARIIAQETNISSKDILNSPLSNEDVNKIVRANKTLSSLPIFFDESSSSSIDQICTSIRRLKIKHGINLAIVDYLQLVVPGSKNKSEEGQIAEITRRLKNIAKELNIPVIALSQFHRDKNNPRPNKSRLRGSGQIEETADIILLIWRPSEYGIPQFPEPHLGVPSQGLAECIVAKGRHYGTCSFLLRFDPKITGFYDYVPEYQDEFNRYNPDQHIESKVEDEAF